MPSRPRTLNGKVVAITGGGRGIGHAIGAALAREGALVAIGDLDAAAAQAVAEELGPPALGLPLDVTDHAGFTEFLDHVEQRLGPLDVLVNNAGIMPITPFVDESFESIARQLEVNLHAVIYGTHEAVRRMRPRGTGHIINVASLAGRTGVPLLVTYCATKHGVVGLCEAMRSELRGSGIEISVLMPGFVHTELSTGVRELRGLKTTTVENVADAVVAALRVPRFEIYVPRRAGPIVAITSAMPRRLREAIIRAAGRDQALLHADRAQRAAYEARAATSAPAAQRARSQAG